MGKRVASIGLYRSMESIPTDIISPPPQYANQVLGYQMDWAIVALYG